LPGANIAREYSVVTAACLLTRKSVFENLGGFDPRYRNGYEDVDYCYKVGAAGFKVVYRPESVAIHYESQSGPERFAYESANLKKLISRWQGRVPLDIRRLREGKVEFLRPFRSYRTPVESLE
jgi:GT2 family glycosyltransferase